MKQNLQQSKPKWLVFSITLITLLALLFIIIYKFYSPANPVSDNIQLTDNNVYFAKYDRQISIRNGGATVLPRSMTINKGTNVIFSCFDNNKYIVTSDLFRVEITKDQPFTYTFNETGEYKIAIDKIDNILAKIIVKDPQNSK